jgi:all-trans-retinol 13,14-reductase
MGYDRFEDTLISYFPEEKEAILKYTQKLKEVSGALNLYNLKEVEAYNFIDSDFVTKNAQDFITSCTDNYLLQNIFAGLNSLYAGVKEKTPLLIHALINNFYIESAYRFVDGSEQLAVQLGENIKSKGGTILTKSEVVKFGFEDEELTHIELKNGEKIFGKNFISGIHPTTTLEMCDTKKIRKVYRKRINSLQNTIGVFSIYCTLYEDSFPYMNYNYYYAEEENVWLTELYQPGQPPKGYMLFTPATSKTDIYADCLSIICYMSMDEVKQWENTTVEKRGSDYKDFKKAKADEALSVVERAFPDIRKHIKSVYTSTPLTYRDYTGTIDGSIYGFQKDSNDPAKSYIPPRTKVPNLFLTGQNINLHGILGVTIGSVLTCGEFIGINNLIRKINNA